MHPPQIERPTRRSAGPWTWGWVAFACVLGVVHPVAGQVGVPDRAAAEVPCPNGRISNVFIDSHSVFDERDRSSEGRLSWFYTAANAIHWQTRTPFVGSELLFSTGDCLDPFLLQETERLLRDYSFLKEVDVYPVPQGDSSVHVVVDTEDEWTTQLRFNANLEEGFEVRSISLEERNFLGRGVFLGLSLRRQQERREFGGEIRTPRVFGTRWDARASYGTTREGAFREFGVAYPFVGEVGRVAALATWADREDLFGYLVEADPVEDVPIHLLVPFRSEDQDLAIAARLGQPGNLTVFGAGIARREVRFPDPLLRSRLARDSDFDETDPAPAELVQPALDQLADRSADRLVFMLGQRNIRFVRRIGLDALRGAEDIRTGFEASVTLGRSVAVLGGQGDAAPDDLYTRVHLFGATARGDVVLSSAATWEGRRVSDSEGEGAPWRDSVGKLSALLYWQPSALAGHTLFGRVSAAGGWHTEAPFQLSLGGASGVRGYRPWELPGGRSVVATLEDRIAVTWPAPEFLDLGFTVFADAGKVWTGDAPFGVDSGWRTTLGAGLRVGFPEGSRSVIRFDIASALDGGFRSPVFRITVGEPAGITSGFVVPQVDRSMPLRLGTDVLGQAWR